MVASYRAVVLHDTIQHISVCILKKMFSTVQNRIPLNPDAFDIEVPCAMPRLRQLRVYPAVRQCRLTAAKLSVY
jgi:hypothetical protein